MSVPSDDVLLAFQRSRAWLTLVTLGYKAFALRPPDLRDPPAFARASWPIRATAGKPDLPDPPDLSDPPAFARASWPMRATAGKPDLPDFDQFEPLLPVRQQLIDAGGRRRGDLEPPGRLPVGRVHQLAVSDEIDQAECGDAGLSRPEEVARSAQLQITLGDLEPVGGLGQRLQPLARLVGQRRLIQQKAERLVAIATDAPSKLMELRQPEAL